MSSPNDDGYEILSARDASSAYGVADHYSATPRMTQAETVAAAPADVAVKITLSPEAKAAIAGQTNRAAEQAQATASAKEIAAVAGVSQATAVQATQPTRAPPPAKGAALFQANLSADRNPKE